MPSPRVIDHLADAVDAMPAAEPGDTVPGIALAIGKPKALVNALCRRIATGPTRRLTIVTALSLEKPVGQSDLERQLLEPLIERAFGDYPDLDDVKARATPACCPTSTCASSS